jgi:hypothetical protein
MSFEQIVKQVWYLSGISVYSCIEYLTHCVNTLDIDDLQPENVRVYEHM